MLFGHLSALGLRTDTLPWQPFCKKNLHENFSVLNPAQITEFEQKSLGCMKVKNTQQERYVRQGYEVIPTMHKYFSTVIIKR